MPLEGSDGRMVRARDAGMGEKNRSSTYSFVSGWLLAKRENRAIHESGMFGKHMTSFHSNQ